MKNFVLIIGLLIGFLSLFSKTNEQAKLCNTFSDCVQKSEKTDIYRKKISFYDEALKLAKDSDSENSKARVYLNRANALVKEAMGDTGYKGEIPLKVTHKPEYKDAQFKKALEDLKEVEKVLNQLSTTERTLYDDLLRTIQSN